MLFDRQLTDNLKKYLNKNKAIIIYGPRQVGKSTLVKTLQGNYQNSKYLDGEDFNIQERLQTPNLRDLRNWYPGLDLLIIDEAQKIPNIGSTLKLLVDHFKDMQVIALGSSSFDLANKLNEPLTGRKYTFTLYPISLYELSKQQEIYQVNQQLEDFLIYGMYPEILTSQPDLRERNLYQFY